MRQLNSEADTQLNSDGEPERPPNCSTVQLSGSSVPRTFLRTLASNLHWLFLLFAIPQVIFLALCTPPFQTADENAHFDRAWQVAHLQLSPHYGGFVDTGIIHLWDSVSGIGFHPEARYTSAEQSAAGSAQWTGQSGWRDFPNTGTCAFTGYLPQALGIFIGRAIGLGPLRTLQFARLVNGAFSIFICTLALRWCRRGRLVVFAALLMPMTLSLFASCGQDATLIALACAAFAVVSRRLEEGKPLSRVQLAAVCFSLLVVALGRPPYVALFLLLLVPGLIKRWPRGPSWLPGLSAALLLFAATAAWWSVAMHVTRAVARPIAGIGVVDARMQLINLAHHPAISGDLLLYCLHHLNEYIAGAIGYLGWLDTTMPPLYYLAMLMVLIAAALAEMSSGPAIAKSATTLSLAAAAAGVAAVFMVEYLIWTPVGAHGIYGVQGRYFIPLIVAVSIGLPRLSHSPRTRELVTAAVVAAQLITVIVLPRVLLARYYGG